jgi:hypothetical protein
MARSSTDALRSLKKYTSQALGDNWEVRLAYEQGVFSRPFCRVGYAGRAIPSGPAFETTMVQPFNLLCHPQETENEDESLIEAGRVMELLIHAFRIGVGAIDTPTDPVAVGGAGGTLPANTYFYRVTALTRHGESAPTPSFQAAAPANGAVTLSWAEVPEALRYRVYRGTLTGTERLYAEMAADSATPGLVDRGQFSWPTAVAALPRVNGRGSRGYALRVPLWDWEGVPLTETSTQRRYPDYMRVADFSVDILTDPDDELRRAVAADLRLSWRRRGVVPESDQTLQGIGFKRNV